MKISTSTRAIIIALVGVALASAAPATGDRGGTEAASGASAAGGDDGKLTLRRDGSRAVPFVPSVGPSTSATERDGFDWGDAAIGAGGALSVMLLASGAVASTRRRGHPGAQPTFPA